MSDVLARYSELNKRRGGGSFQAKDSEAYAWWSRANMHFWRARAMYHGGDCYLAGFPGAVPHQKLYPQARTTMRPAILAWRSATTSKGGES